MDDVLGMEAWFVETETTWVRELDPYPWGRIGTVLDAEEHYVRILEGEGRGA